MADFGDIAPNEELLTLSNDKKSSTNDIESSLRGQLQDATCCTRFKLLCLPIQSFTVKHEQNDSSVDIIIIPEAFRMWFYFGLTLFTLLAVVISLNYSTELDLDDNIFRDLYGGNFICLYYDYPPFSYFSAILWFPLVSMIIMYEIFDQFRVYDAYIDKDIGKTFYIWYSSFTVFELFVWIVSVQFPATNPDENIYVHTIPFFLLLVALWTISFKRFFYIRKVGVFDSYNKLVHYMGWIYILLLLLCMVALSLFLWPNLFGARLYEHPSFRWTYYIMRDIVNLWLFLSVVAPVVIYFVITKDLKTLRININRSRNKRTQ